MVGGTGCPAGSDPVKKWSSEAAPKDQCPLEHRGEFPDVPRGQIQGPQGFHVIQFSIKFSRYSMEYEAQNL